MHIAKLKEENGSITLYVLVALVLISIGLFSMYISNINKQAADLEVARQIKGIYEKDINNIDNIYNNLVAE